MTKNADRILATTYQSLMYEPELPDEILMVETGCLPDVRRALNKRSWARGCDADERRWPHVEAPSAFREGERCFSLALGTEDAPGDALHGLVLHYPAEVREALLTALDAREGYRFDAPPAEQHYTRETRTIEAALEPRDAITYLSNPAGPAHVPDLTIEEQARVLVAATPRPGGDRARGLDYVTRSRECARMYRLPTPVLDAVTQAAVAQNG